MYDYAGNADRSMGYWDPERKLGVARLFFFFSEIIIQQLFLKAVKYKVMYGVFFFQIEAFLSLKNASLPPISFLNSRALAKFYFLP